MALQQADAAGMVTALVPSLSHSLAEQFNVFKVMHHGTHEKQLSNVIAWLLDDRGSHGLGDVFQRLFLARINATGHQPRLLPPSGYRVTQEVDTRSDVEIEDGGGKDIADIVLTRPEAVVVIENYETSDGHGHGFDRYRDYATSTTGQGAVVLLCLRRAAHLQREGWEKAHVITYADVLSDLHAHVQADRSWRDRHRDQLFYIRQLTQHFVEGYSAVNVTDQVTFIKAMCDTGESSRYGNQNQTQAADDFADQLAQHARLQFTEARALLAQVKKHLRDFARVTLTAQVNAELGAGHVETVSARFAGTWQWCVTLERPDGYPAVFLEFGPTAVEENKRVPEPLRTPDYSRLFVLLQGPDGSGVQSMRQSDVTLEEVIAGLSRDDHRLRDAVLEVIAHP